ncbi:MAG TPA: CpsB/CapC family capsule biosynthesis tyrosine phosphatase [Tepidisphaeraceae bacterium]|jgi:protein-tyrosine phosphatase
MGRIDVHAHLLPGVDDGSRTLDESIAIARRMAAAGYSRLVCTPHIWPQLDNTTVTTALRVAELQAALDAADVNLTLHAGGEMHLSRQFLATPAEDLVTYDNAGKYALFDFWTDTLPPYFEKAVRKMVDAGITPILAHPERIEAVQRDPDVVARAGDLGLLLQCNLECVGEGETTLRGRLATRWLRERRYFLLGSDVHRIDTLGRRLLGLERAADLVGAAELDRLTIENPLRLITIH